MATTVRSIGAMPFQGGSFNNDIKTHGMVRLTNSRMVWMYYQLNPNWLAASVIDVAGGITGTGSPTLTSQQLLMPYTAQNLMSLGKINQTTFVMVTGNYTGNMLWNVFEVDVAGVFTRVDSGQFGFGSTSTAGAYATFATGNFKVLELKDNLVMFAGDRIGPSSGSLYGAKGVYDPVAKKMTWDTVPVSLLTVGVGSTFELIAKRVPGRDLTMVLARFTNPSSASDTRGCIGAVVDNQTGNVITDQTKLPLNNVTGSNSEMVPLPNDRVAFLTNHYTINWFSVDYITGSYISLGTSTFAPASAADTQGRFLMPLTADYVLIMNRLPMFTLANPHRFKVVRRVDQQLSEQSPASASNNNTGFGLNSPATTVAAFHQTYPEFIDGKVVWFGLDNATTPTKFSWAVVSLEP